MRTCGYATEDLWINVADLWLLLFQILVLPKRDFLKSKGAKHIFKTSLPQQNSSHEARL